MWQSNVIGILAFRSKAERAYGQRDLNLANRVSDLVAGSIAGARLRDEITAASNEHMRAMKLDAQNKQLHAEAKYRSGLISVVSHELRTPLTSLKAMAEVLQKNRPGTLTESQLQQVTVIRRSAMWLFMLINDLLAASRLEVGELVLDYVEIEIGGLLDELTATMSPLIQGNDQKLDLSGCDRTLVLRADRMRVHQILNNLISNASKYSPHQSTIALSVYEENGKLVMTVRDEGIGISEDDLDRIFETYFRADDEVTRSIEGTGLGLHITKSLVDLHGGQIDVESALGKGSCFTVIIPGIVDKKLTERNVA